MRVGTASAPDILGYFHIWQKLLFRCSYVVNTVAMLVTALIPLLLTLVIKASICGAPSGNARVKPAERTCAGSGSRTLHFFVVFSFLSRYVHFVGTRIRMISPQKRGNTVQAQVTWKQLN